MTGRGILGLALAVPVALCLVAPAGAQALRDATGPAEVPPASYTATQYVDSKGCAFVRAGLGGKVTWVPRVTQDRKQMCGQVPSLGAVAAAVPPASAVAPAAPAAMTPAATPGPAKAAPKAAPRTSPAVVPVAAPMAARRARPSTVAVAAPTGGGAVALVSAEVVPGSATSCPNTPATAERYVLSDGRRLVRCGPPVRDPVAYLNGLGRPGLRVARAGGPAAAVPAGYVRAWKDDRLNPARNARTAEGDARMAASWDASVPMRMKPGTALRVPYSGSDGAFVQAGAFADPGNADRAVARLKAAGLPAARAKGMIGGRIVAFVLAGPVDRAQAASALAAVRAAGFGDAYLR
jgi:hypothetical protein